MSEIILIGTNNKHKVKELTELLASLPWEVRRLSDFPCVPEAVEDGDTFEANALLKARYYCQAHNIVCAADDSGIVVDALGGAPGIYSARYAGEQCRDLDNNAKLLEELRGTPMDKRTARFMCCAAIAHPDGWTHVETGAVEGRIDFSPSGENGFGYDPLFIPEGYDKTFGELSSEIKQRISHRARAFGKLKKYLEELEGD